MENYELNQNFEIVTRRLVLPRDLNGHGNLYGGSMLSWIDESSYLYAVEKIGYTNMVTVSLENVRFRSPAKMGDSVIILCRIYQIKKTSITIQTKAIVHDTKTNQTSEIIDCFITFVCLKNGKPFPYFKTEEFKNKYNKNDINDILIEH
ncbi:MAG: acyl-CoA thioesterase [Leptospiraceae bacterium]|nr:MAG: acyl-CoA thioesterase [Leptospiraceae bacterium]